MKYLAVIDVGSHEMSMVIYQLRQKARAKILEKVVRSVSAGVDTYRIGRISDDLVSAILNVMADFKTKLAEYPGIKVISVATSAVREASNRLFLVDKIKREYGIEVRVLNNNEETYYQLLSTIENTENIKDILQEQTLIMDLGAGSTQFTAYDEGELISTHNVKLGSLRLSAILAELRDHTVHFDRYLAEYIEGDLSYYQRFESNINQVKHLLINGGHLQYLRQMADLPLKGTIVLSKDVFLKVAEELQSKNLGIIAQKKHIPLDRASLLLPSVLMLQEIFSFTGLDEAILVDASLEDGVAIDFVQKHLKYPEKRDMARDNLSLVRQISDRHHSDRTHCEGVAKLAVQIFDESRKIHALSDEERELLQYAALLHNVGKYVSMDNDAMRTYEIVRSFSIPGLSERKLEFLARVILYHDSLLDKKNPDLSLLDDQTALKIYQLSAILNLANALDISHTQKIESLRFKRQKNQWKVYLYSDEDITLELWNLAQSQLFFEEVFLCRLNFVTRPIPASKKG